VPSPFSAKFYARFRSLIVLLLVWQTATAGAQDISLKDTTGSVRCDGLTVRAVEIETQRPEFKGLLGWWRKLAHGIGLHHETTSPKLVRRFVTLEPGEGCTEFRRSESERILRAQPFLADADVVANRVGDSVLVDVSTVDEMPVVAGGRLHAGALDALNLGTMNFLGAGAHVEGRWERGRVYRNGYGMRLGHQQVFGRPYEFMFDGIRHPIGEQYSVSLSHPFFTDLQRVAWHTGYRTSKDFSRLRRPDRTAFAEPLNHTVWNAGGVVRFGPPGKLGLLGAMIVGEHLFPMNELFEVDTISGLLSPSSDSIRLFERYDATHLASVLGLRALTFSRMRALDALVAEQDMAIGTQIGAILGTQPLRAPLLHRGFASVDVYSGQRTRHSFTGVRAEVESRLDLTKRQWRHLIASGRGAWYYKSSDRWTSEVSLEASGGWRTIMPFQLELGEREGGVSGYARSLEAGAQRVVMRGEQRVHLGEFRRRAALGAAVFTDAGRVWAGDAPYGVTTPIRASVGVALLAAVPIQSQRTIRAEIAFPTARALGARPELRFSIREPAHGFWIDPPRIRWARLSLVPEQIFSWP